MRYALCVIEASVSVHPALHRLSMKTCLLREGERGGSPSACASVLENRVELSRETFSSPNPLPFRALSSSLREPSGREGAPTSGVHRVGHLEVSSSFLHRTGPNDRHHGLSALNPHEQRVFMPFVTEVVSRFFHASKGMGSFPFFRHHRDPLSPQPRVVSREHRPHDVFSSDNTNLTA
jgi:hypothetical protein